MAKALSGLRIHNIGTLLTMRPQPGESNLGIVRDASLVIEDERVSWAGPTADVPDDLSAATLEVFDAEGAVVSPGLIDAHTHVVYAGDRAGEFAMRAAGRTYTEIAAAGGGILSTVRATRAASKDELADAARPRLSRMLARGVTTVEAKSGYGLTLDAELKILDTIRTLSAEGPVELVPTFLGAHALPPDTSLDAYIEEVVATMQVVADEELARFCDVFVEEGFFGVDTARRLCEIAAGHGLKIKLHVDQLHDGGGAALAAEVGAVSADHLDFANDESLEALAAAGTVAVLLPGAALYLGVTPPDARRFLAAGVRVAVATDCNPGTCPTEDLPLMATLAVTTGGLTMEQAWLSMTTEAAAAVARSDLGYLATGAQADLVVWDFDEPAHLPYHFGSPQARLVVKRGEAVFTSR